MPLLLPYPTTLSTLQSLGLRSLYHNSGAFGFPDPATTRYAGWIGPPDPTLRHQMLPLVTRIPEPHAPTLANLALRAWQTHLPAADAWLMPLAHWSYELDFGSATWLPAALSHIQIDPTALSPLHTGNALAFSPSEPTPFQYLLEQLLTHLQTSDFMLAFPPHRLLCTIHHHQQLWWTSDDAALLDRINRTPTN